MGDFLWRPVGVLVLDSLGDRFSSSAESFFTLRFSCFLFSSSETRLLLRFVYFLFLILYILSVSAGAAISGSLKDCLCLAVPLCVYKISQEFLFFNMEYCIK